MSKKDQRLTVYLPADLREKHATVPVQETIKRLWLEKLASERGTPQGTTLEIPMGTPQGTTLEIPMGTPQGTTLEIPMGTPQGTTVPKSLQKLAAKYSVDPVTMAKKALRWAGIELTTNAKALALVVRHAGGTPDPEEPHDWRSVLQPDGPPPAAPVAPPEPSAADWDAAIKESEHEGTPHVPDVEPPSDDDALSPEDMEFERTFRAAGSK